jgi:hypothetical protein
MKLNLLLMVHFGLGLDFFLAMIPIQRLYMLSFEGYGPRQRQCLCAIVGTAYWTETGTAKMLRAIVGPSRGT